MSEGGAGRGSGLPFLSPACPEALPEAPPCSRRLGPRVTPGWRGGGGRRHWQWEPPTGLFHPSRDVLTCGTEEGFIKRGDTGAGSQRTGRSRPDGEMSAGSPGFRSTLLCSLVYPFSDSSHNASRGPLAPEGPTSPAFLEKVATAPTVCVPGPDLVAGTQQRYRSSSR